MHFLRVCEVAFLEEKPLNGIASGCSNSGFAKEPMALPHDRPIGNFSGRAGGLFDIVSNEPDRQKANEKGG